MGFAGYVDTGQAVKLLGFACRFSNAREAIQRAAVPLAIMRGFNSIIDSKICQFVGG